MSKTMRFSLQMALATLISRILGLVRDMLFAEKFGSSPEYDAYLVAILLPFVLRRIFAEGALSTAFIPIFNKKNLKDPESGKKFANTILTIFIPTIMILIILSIYSMPFIISAMAPGLSPETKEIAVFLGKIVFPFILFISMWSVYNGILNSYDIYFTPALSPAFHNIFIIAGIFLSPFFNPPILGPTIFFLMGGAVQWFAVLIPVNKLKFKLQPTFDKNDLKEFLPLFLSSFAALSITQINSVVDTVVVSNLQAGSVSWLQYANRLFQLPLGVFAVSVSTVALSQLSRKDSSEFKESLADSFEKMVLFVLPSTIALLLARQDIITLLFKRGAFGSYDVLMTTAILNAYLYGLPFFSVYSLFSRAEYAMKRGKIAFLASAVSVTSNVILDISFAPVLGAAGVALATTIAGFAGMTVILVHLIKLKLLRLSKNNIVEILKICVGTAGMGIFLLLSGKLNGYSSIKTILEFLFAGIIFLGILLLLKQKDMIKVFRKVFRV